MDLIFHEKQEGYLCAQHCLNALLQGPYFTPVDLASLAQQMDEQERIRMAECGIDSEEYRSFLEQPSGNMDDSGFFSVQVISSALDVWNLELVPYNSSEPRALQAQATPQEMQAYICNYRDHWFTIRRLGRQWFNLNSMLTGPQLISNTYLSVYLAQLQHEGYSIFVVFGTLPDCQAHEVLLVQPVVQSSQPRPVEVAKISHESRGHRLGSTSDDSDLQRAIQISLGQDPSSSDLLRQSSTDEEDDNLQRALQESMRDQTNSNCNAICANNDGSGEALRSQREEKNRNETKISENEPNKTSYLQSEDNNKKLSTTASPCVSDDDDDDDDLKEAMKLSLECMNNEVTQTSETDASDVRARRLKYFERSNNTTAGRSSAV